MAFLSVQFFAPSIQKNSSMYVILPEKKGPFPVLYLLHGLSDDHTTWLRRTSLERYAADLGLIIAMPDGHRSWYCNDTRTNGLAYEDYICKDVVGFVDHAFPTLAAPRGRAIAGLSMGGYGAIMHYLRHPDVFSAASSHSGAVGFACPKFALNKDIDAISQVFPSSKYDLFALTRKHAKAGHALKLRMDVGTEDFLIEHNRAFHAHLDKLHLAHEYAEFPGIHEWDYWDRHVGKTLDFAMKHFAGLKKK